MKLTSAFTLIPLLLWGCSHSHVHDCVSVQSLPSIGSPLARPAGVVAPTVFGNTSFCITHASIQYSAERSDATGLAVALSTSDPRFRTPEGAGMESSSRDLIALGGRPLPPDSISCRIALPSGWVARIPGVRGLGPPSVTVTNGSYSYDTPQPPLVCTPEILSKGHVVAFERHEEGGV